MPATSLCLPLLTMPLAERLFAARNRKEAFLTCSLDLGRTTERVESGPQDWGWRSSRFPYPPALRDRTVYAWNGADFEPAARFAGSLVKLVPTEWGPPTFEIDGIKMLPTAKVSPFEDACTKVERIAPRGKRILDCCGGLGYFAHWCLTGQATVIHSFEKSETVLWLRGLNPWSPRADVRLKLTLGNIAKLIDDLPSRSFDAILHDPPRFGTAGELYSQVFYEQLARVVVPGGLLFHYTGTPNKLTSGRDVPKEISRRLQKAGFATQPAGDGVLARRLRRRPR